MTSRLLSILAAFMLFIASVPASADDRFSKEDRAEFEKIIKEYLLENPEVLIEAIEVYRTKQERAREMAARLQLSELRPQLEHNPGDPLIGNPNGDVTIVEFFDYQCGYCKMATRTLMKVLKDDGNIRLVLKEFPILGEMSVFAARASLAARNQGKYETFHLELIGYKGRLTEEAVLQVAKETGLDMKQLQTDMNSAEIRAEIEKNFELAQKLNIQGTPAFTIGSQLFPGAIQEDQMKQAVQIVRSKG